MEVIRSIISNRIIRISIGNVDIRGWLVAFRIDTSTYSVRYFPDKKTIRLTFSDLKD